jgi:hypothetical protein
MLMLPQDRFVPGLAVFLLTKGLPRRLCLWRPDRDGPCPAASAPGNRQSDIFVAQLTGD